MLAARIQQLTRRAEAGQRSEAVVTQQTATDDIRASAQSLISFTSGVGLLMGYVLSGVVNHRVQGAFRPTFAVAAALAGSALVLFGLGFHPRHAPEET